MRGLAVVKTVGVAVRVVGTAVDVIASAPGIHRRWTRPRPLAWLRAGSLDRRLTPYSALGKDLPPDADRR